MSYILLWTLLLWMMMVTSMQRFIMKYLCLVVKVSFDKPKYTYSENHGTVNDMNLKLNTSIAQSLTVGVVGMYIKTLSYYVNSSID